MISCFPASESPYSSTSGREDAAHPSTKAPRPERCTRTLRGRAGGRVHARVHRRSLTRAHCDTNQSPPGRISRMFGRCGFQCFTFVYLRLRKRTLRHKAAPTTVAASLWQRIRRRDVEWVAGLCFGSPSRLAPLNLHIFLPVQQHAGLVGRKWYTEFNHFDVYLFLSL